MKFQKSSEFRYLRDMSIIFTVLEGQISIQSAIQMNKNSMPKLSSNQALDIFQEYYVLRRARFPQSNLLYLTDDGKLFLPEKFKQNFKKFLRDAGITLPYCHPSQLTSKQMDELIKLKFMYQRPIYQAYLAAGLLGYQALRPNEVAKLVKEDIILSEEIIILRDTKSREDQQIIIYPDLMKPLKNYLKYIGPGEPLFVRESHRQWDRRDVYRAIKNIGTHHGFKQINPRRFRASVANYMINAGIPIKFISIYLRHKDVATTLRHYMGVAGINDVRIASKFLHALLSGQTISFHEFVSNERVN
jgi:integrase